MKFLFLILIPINLFSQNIVVSIKNYNIYDIKFEKGILSDFNLSDNIFSYEEEIKIPVLPKTYVKRFLKFSDFSFNETQFNLFLETLKKIADTLNHQHPPYTSINNFLHEDYSSYKEIVGKFKFNYIKYGRSNKDYYVSDISYDYVKPIYLINGSDICIGSEYKSQCILVFNKNELNEFIDFFDGFKPKTMNTTIIFKNPYNGIYKNP